MFNFGSLIQHDRERRQGDLRPDVRSVRRDADARCRRPHINLPLILLVRKNRHAHIGNFCPPWKSPVLPVRAAQREEPYSECAALAAGIRRSGLPPQPMELVELTDLEIYQC